MKSTIAGVWIDVGRRETKSSRIMIIIWIPRKWILDADSCGSTDLKITMLQRFTELHC